MTMVSYWSNFLNINIIAIFIHFSSNNVHDTPPSPAVALKERRRGSFADDFNYFFFNFIGRATADAVRNRQLKPLITNMYYVYILKCSDEMGYIGCTNNLKDRINRHVNGGVPATASRRPIKLVFYSCFDNKYKAFEFEKYLKSGSGRAFIKKHFV